MPDNAEYCRQYRKRQKQAIDLPICKCGKKLVSDASQDLGKCSYCRKLDSQPKAVRCGCGAVLRGEESRRSRKCKKCRA